MNVCVYTLGCRLNQAESEAVADAFSKAGFFVVDEESDVDLYVVNTCTVTSKAEQKCRRMIRKFAENAPVIVTGCYAQLNAGELSALSPNVTVYSLDRKASLMGLPSYLEGKLDEGMELHAAVRTYRGGTTDRFAFDANSFSYHSRAYLKIQDGCDNACAYCRVHVARGKALDLDAEVVVQRALRLEEEGFHEIMLTGVNLTMYDHRGEGLGALVEKLLLHLGSDVRLRLSSMEPDHVDDRLIDTFADYRMQPHFHIPVQSASRKVLRRVNRFNDMDRIGTIIMRLRKMKDDPFLAADVITGLPSEGDAEFQETYDFFRQYDFSMLHVFPFSPRPDTPLYTAKDRVPESIRDERAKILRELAERHHQAYKERQGGKCAEVILEQRKGGFWYGTTGNYLDVRVLDAPPFARRGDLLPVVFEKGGMKVRLDSDVPVRKDGASSQILSVSRDPCR
jgi:threonylcarbamoyladenosine tRNA methylthiotransferase MtaB